MCYVLLPCGKLVPKLISYKDEVFLEKFQRLLHNVLHIISGMGGMKWMMIWNRRSYLPALCYYDHIWSVSEQVRTLNQL